MTISRDQAMRLRSAVRDARSVDFPRFRRSAAIAVFLAAVSSAAAVIGLSLGAGAFPRAEENQMKLGAMATVVTAVSAMAVGGQAEAQVFASAIEWPVSEGGNGHWYATIRSGTGLDVAAWTTRAGSLGATLFTGCGAEFEFAVGKTHALDPAGWLEFNGQQLGPWIGLRLESGAWAWVDGTACSFDRWAAGQPDSTGEDAVALYSASATPAAECHDIMAYRLAKSAIVEWSADCNNDGIVDYGQCLYGQLADADLDNIPDVCEGKEVGYVAVADSYQQFSSTQGQDGWTYWFDGGAGTAPQLMEYFIQAPFFGDRAAWCAEQVFGPGGSYCALWRGSSHVATASNCESPGPLQRPRRLWQSTVPVTGRLVVSGTFRAHSGTRERIEVLVDGVQRFVKDAASGPTVDDLERFGAVIDVVDCTSVEIISDPLDGSCDADSMHYLVRVLAEDCDGDGSPDPCGIRVPQDFPTIQAAIDSVPAGVHGLVSVAAGAYHESFALNGKDVVVRGAANNATILDGTGIATSIARFTGNEPATAGVENLVFRNGTAGSLLYQGAAFEVGGAIYGLNSAAFIRNCRFEHCASDYGGAVYLLYCRVNVSGCTFDSNTAFDEGGGLFVYETTGPVLNCVFTSNDTSVNGPGAGSAFKAVGARSTGEAVELTGCTFAGNRGLLTASAIEYYENVQSNPGVLRISGCSVTGNQSGTTIPSGAAGLRVLGRNTSCIITGGTTICSNSPKNIEGPYLIDGLVTVCDCNADITGDGLVNGGDLGVLLSAWGVAGALGTGDVNHDGLVDATDLSAVLGSWGACH